MTKLEEKTYIQDAFLYLVGAGSCQANYLAHEDAWEVHHNGRLYDQVDIGNRKHRYVFQCTTASGTVSVSFNIPDFAGQLARRFNKE